MRPFAPIGLVPDGGATWHLVRAMGYKRAYQAIIEGRKIPAAECLALGLANQVVKSAGFAAAVLAYAKGLAERAPLALRYSKQLARSAMSTTLDACIREEAALQNITIASRDSREAVASLLAKAHAGLQGTLNATSRDPFTVIRKEESMQLGSSISAVITGGASGLGAAHRAAPRRQWREGGPFRPERREGRGPRGRVGRCVLPRGRDLRGPGGCRVCQGPRCHWQERILVNCAGTGNAIKTAGFDKATGQPKHFPMAAFEKIIQINLIGTFRCIAKSAVGMLALALEQGERGVIINTASVAAQDGQMGQAAYSASKAGVVGMTLPVARDLMNEGIRVNTILPGIFDTPLLAAAPEKVRAALAASVPFPKRLGHPDEFASSSRR